MDAGHVEGCIVEVVWTAGRVVGCIVEAVCLRLGALWKL